MAERGGVPHHFIDICTPDQVYSAGDFGHAARRVIGRLWAAGKVPILAGGSGLYVSAALDGLRPVPDKPPGPTAPEATDPDPARRRQAALAIADPVARDRVHPHDQVRLERALALGRAGAGRTGQWEGPEAEPLGGTVVVCGLGLPREVLYRRIEARTDAMMAAGLAEETAALAALGYAADCQPLATLGYAQCRAYLAGALDRRACVAEIKRATRRYAKRQLTWFGADRRVRWLDAHALGARGVTHRILQQVAAEAAAA